MLGGGGGRIDRIVVAGCDPAMQKKLFSRVFKELDFDESKFTGIKIRNMTTEEAIKAIEKALED